MKNYKLKIEYNGTNYSGWQIQNEDKTIQGEVENALSVFLREKTQIIGSGRTDAGVHALGQVANFRSEIDFDIKRLQLGVNSILPNDISLIDISEVNYDFHSRFDAVKRSYIYLFNNVKTPFYRDFSTLNRDVFHLDLGRLNEVSKTLLGIHDFTSFAKKNTETENKVCEIFTIRWKKENHFLRFYIQGNRFLHGMVRTIIGTLLESLKHDNPVSYLKNVLDERDRDAAGMSVPSKGLFLFNVKYKNETL